MLKTEFIDRTGYCPTDCEYHNVIEPEYYNYPFGKDEFCHHWLLEQLHTLRERAAKYETMLRNGHRLTQATLDTLRSIHEAQHTFNKHLIFLHNKIYGNSENNK